MSMLQPTLFHSPPTPPLCGLLLLNFRPLWSYINLFYLLIPLSSPPIPLLHLLPIFVPRRLLCLSVCMRYTFRFFHCMRLRTVECDVRWCWVAYVIVQCWRCMIPCCDVQRLAATVAVMSTATGTLIEGNFACNCLKSEMFSVASISPRTGACPMKFFYISIRKLQHTREIQRSEWQTTLSKLHAIKSSERHCCDFCYR